MTTATETGRLTILEEVGKYKGQYKVRCRCICGKTKVFYRSNVTTGKTKSCGCLNAELLQLRSRTHGMTGTLEYSCWQNMKVRCNNPSHEAHARYKAKGITVCAEWLHSFEQFLSDMGTCPPDKNSIDRKDNSKGYCKENCRWSDPAEQANNH